MWKKQANQLFKSKFQCIYHSAGQKIKKVQAKKFVKSNKSKNLFSWNCIFGSFPSSKIDFWPFLKFAKNGIWSKKLFVKWIYLFHDFLAWTFFSKLCRKIAYRFHIKNIKIIHSFIRGVLIQSCPSGAKNFTNYEFCYPQFSGGKSLCHFDPLFAYYVDYYQNNQFYRVKISFFKILL